MGIIDKDGNERLKCVYDSLGYTKTVTTTDDDEEENEESSNTTNQVDNQLSNTTSKNTTTNLTDYDSVLTIPESVGIKGIVVNLNGLYGIFDAEVKHLIIPCACSKIYAKTRAGVTKYYLEYNEQELDLENYLKENNLISVKKAENLENPGTSESQDNES